VFSFAFAPTTNHQLPTTNHQLLTGKRLRVKNFSHPTYRCGNSRSRIHHAVSPELVNPLVPDGWNRRQRFPCAQIAAAGARSVDADLDDDVGCARNRKLACRLNALTIDVGKHIRAARGVEHVVQEADCAAGVNASKRLRIAAERGRGRPATLLLTSAISASIRSASAVLSFVLPIRAPSSRIVLVMSARPAC